MFKKLLPAIPRVLLSQAANSSKLQLNSVRSYGIYEPNYLESLKPKFPQYECLNFQVTGYDYPILESYQKFLHNVAEYLELDVSECYALPPKQTHIQRLKPASTVVDADYKLTTYERNLQVSNLDAPMYPLFLRIAQAGLPEGVTLNVVEFTEEHEEVRYVPDKDLNDLRTQLDSISYKKN